MQQTETKEKKPLTKAEQRKRAQRVRTLARVGVQLVFFFLAPSLFTEAFAGVKYIFQQLAAGGVLEWNAFLRTLVYLCLFTVFFGRFFCGFACAFGAVGDWVWMLSSWIQKKIQKKWKKKLPALPEKVQVGMQWIKYIILAAIVVLCALGVYGSLSGWSPWDVFSRLSAGRLPAAGYGLGIGLLVLIVLGMAWKERFFCQFLCPMGAVFSLIPVLPWSSLRRDRESCLPRCSACQRTCPVALGLDGSSLRSGECIRCGKCVSACPKGNIKTGISKWRGDEWWIGLIEGAILLLLVKLG